MKYVCIGILEAVVGAVLILAWPFVFTAWTLYCIAVRLFSSRASLAQSGRAAVL